MAIVVAAVNGDHRTEIDLNVDLAESRFAESQRATDNLRARSRMGKERQRREND